MVNRKEVDINIARIKKNMPKQKDNSITVQKKALWKIFSMFIRMRDCLEATGTLDNGRCCTCGKSYTIKKLQAGHFIPGRMDSILFEPTCVHSQCYRCNVRRSGEWVKYYRFMQKKYGQAQIDYLMELSEQVRVIDEEWVASTAIYYLAKIDELREVYAKTQRGAEATAKA